jgi:hypothetical protein
MLINRATQVLNYWHKHSLGYLSSMLQNKRYLTSNLKLLRPNLRGFDNIPFWSGPFYMVWGGNKALNVGFFVFFSIFCLLFCFFGREVGVLETIGFRSMCYGLICVYLKLPHARLVHINSPTHKPQTLPYPTPPHHLLHIIYTHI